MTTMIRVENLSKHYRIGAQEEMPRTAVEAAMRFVTSPLANFRRLSKLTNTTDETENTIWALKDVSFDINEGEVVGIIGRNGAGKSTLLKILSRITHPTEGKVTLYGRVGSLLEVGTGFHKELTGRENVYLNGTILGMKKAEIDRKFDEIVDFSGVSKFIDTPIKRYSSGMQVRLAFAVAAHLEPEILIVDEVLSVGDAEFQKKSIGKMQDVSKSGRTVLFVSHNINAVNDLCQRAIWINNGQIQADGFANTVTADYMKNAHEQDTYQNKGISIAVSVFDIDGNQLDIWRVDQEIIVKVAMESEKAIDSPSMDIAGYSLLDNARLFSIQSDLIEGSLKGTSQRFVTFEFQLTNVGLSTQQIYLDVGIKSSRGSYEAVFNHVIVISTSAANKPSVTKAVSVLQIPSKVSIFSQQNNGSH